MKPFLFATLSWKCRFSYIIIAALSAPVFSQSFMIGQPAPEIKLSAVYQGPAIREIKLEKLRGKIVIIEFWATWCAPCIAEFPHINRLVDTFKAKDVVFISLSTDRGADAERKIKSLLSRVPLNTWVVKDDEDLSTQTSYYAKIIPKTILVDRLGRIQWIGVPKKLSEELVNEFLAENPNPTKIPDGLSMGIKNLGERNSVHFKQPDTVVSILVMESAASIGGFTFFKPTGIELKGLETVKVIEWLYDIPSALIRKNPSFQSKNWNIIIKNQPSKAPDKSDYKSLIMSSIGVTAKEITGEVEALILKCPNGPKSGKDSELFKTSSPGWKHLSYQDGYLAATNSTISDILIMIERTQGFSIIDETDLEGKFEFSMKFKPKDIDSLIENLQDAGLTLTKEKRKLKLLEIQNL